MCRAGVKTMYNITLEFILHISMKLSDTESAILDRSETMRKHPRSFSYFLLAWSFLEKINIKIPSSQSKQFHIFWSKSYSGNYVTDKALTVLCLLTYGTVSIFIRFPTLAADQLTMYFGDVRGVFMDTSFSPTWIKNLIHISLKAWSIIGWFPMVL